VGSYTPPWIPSNCVLSKYKSFVVKKGKDIARNALAKTNFELFCDCETILKLTFVSPMLEIVQNCQRWARRGTLLFLIS